MQGLEHAKPHTRTKVKWLSAAWQLQPSWCPLGGNTPGKSLPLLSLGVGTAEPGRERRKGARCLVCPRGAWRGESCIHPQISLCLPPSFPKDSSAGKPTESSTYFLQAPSPASTHPHPHPHRHPYGCPSPRRHIRAELCPCPRQALHLSLWLLMFPGVLSPSSGDA